MAESSLCRISGKPKGVPGASWDLWGTLGTPPRGGPWDPQDPRGPPWITTRGIFLNSYSARSSSWLHPNPCVATHLANDSSGLFSGGYVENVCGRPQGRAAENQGFRRGWTTHGERSLPIRLQGQASLYFAYMHTCMYIYVYTYIESNQERNDETPETPNATHSTDSRMYVAQTKDYT